MSFLSYAQGLNNPTPDAPGVNDGSLSSRLAGGGMTLNGSANNTLAELSRGQFNDFLSLQLPLLQQQLGQVGNPDYLHQQVDTGRLQASQGIDSGMRSRERQQRAYGLTLSPEQQAAQSRGDAISRATADVTAINRTTDQVRDRDWFLMSGAQAPKIGGLS